VERVAFLLSDNNVKISQAALEIIQLVLNKHILQQSTSVSRTTIKAEAGAEKGLAGVVCDFLIGELYERLGDTRESIRLLAVDILASTIPLANLRSPQQLMSNLLFPLVSPTSSAINKHNNQNQRQPPIQHKNWRVRQQVCANVTKCDST
jgi:hypothetical protein